MFPVPPPRAAANGLAWGDEVSPGNYGFLNVKAKAVVALGLRGATGRIMRTRDLCNVNPQRGRTR